MKRMSLIILLAVLTALLPVAALAQDATEEPTPEPPPVVVIEQPVEEPPVEQPPVVVIDEGGLDGKDILIAIQMIIIGVLALALRNMLPVTLVQGLLNIAKDYAVKTPTTTDDDLLKGAQDLLDAIRAKEAADKANAAG